MGFQLVLKSVTLNGVTTRPPTRAISAVGELLVCDDDKIVLNIPSLFMPFVRCNSIFSTCEWIFC